MSNQDKKPGFLQRSRTPQTLASVFSSFMNSFGNRVNDTDFINNWRGIVGNEIANISNIASIKKTQNKKFNIVLRPVSPAFALELSYKINDIKTSINKYYGSDVVEKISIRK